MRIVYNKDPKLCSAGDTAFTIIEEFSSCNSRESIIECISKWKTMELENSTQLSDWIDVLNKLDSIFEDIFVQDSASFLTPPNIPTNSSNSTNLAHLGDILEFTAKLLSFSFSKDIYNSTERLMVVLTSYHSHFMYLAIECLYYLTLPPPGHRCDCYLGKHTTQLHKNPSYLLMMFEVVESAFFNRSVDIVADLQSVSSDPLVGKTILINHDQKFYINKSSLREIYHNMNIFNIPTDIALGKEEQNSLKPLTQLPDNLIDNEYAVNDIFADTFDTVATIQQSKQVLTYEQQITLLVKCHIHRSMLKRADRIVMLKAMYQSIAILLTCFPDTAVLVSFFHNKQQLLKDFLRIISYCSGEVCCSTNDSQMDIDLDNKIYDEIHQLGKISCYCLSAAVETRDHHSICIFTQYSWLLQELGVNRGQYMGLLPSIIRSSASFLHKIYEDHAHRILTSNCVEDVDGTLSTSEKQRIQFIEHILIFLSSLINLHSTIAALNENGVMTSLLSIIKYGTGQKISSGPDSSDNALLQTGLRRLCPELLYIDSLALEIVESMMNSQQSSLALFREENGLEFVIERLAYETQVVIYSAYKRAGLPISQSHLLNLEYSSSADIGSSVDIGLSSGENIILQVLFSIIGTYLQELHDQNNNDLLQTMLVRNPIFIGALESLLKHRNIMVSTITSALVSLLAEIINKDSAPPTILSIVLNTKIVQNIFTLLKDHPISNKHDLPLTLLGLASSVSLTADGTSLVSKSDIFVDIISLFHCSFQYMPISKSFCFDLPINLGNGMEEIIRHYPIYTNQIMGAIMYECKHICELGESCIGKQHASIFHHGEFKVPENVAELSCGFTSQYYRIMQFVSSLLSCLEGLFVRKSCIEYFLDNDGMDCLLRLRNLSLGTPRYLLTSLACMIDSTVHSIGYSSVETLLHRLIQLVLAADSKKVVLIECVKNLQKLPIWIESAVKFYWEKFGLELLSKAPTPFVNLSFLYLKELNGEANTISNQFHRLLDTLSREPLQQYSGVGSLPVNLIAASNIFRGITLLDYVVELFGLCINPRYNRNMTSLSSLRLSSFITDSADESLNSASSIGQGEEELRAANRGQLSELELLSTELKSPQVIRLLQNLFNQFYLPTQFEMTRARGSFITATSQSDCVKVQPIYVLLVVSDSVVIKDSCDEANSKKLGKLSKGTVIYAFERKTNSHNALKYHLFKEAILPNEFGKLPGDYADENLPWNSHDTNFVPNTVGGGWIPVYRNVTSTDPQIIVIDILQKPRGLYEQEYNYNTKNLLITSQKKFEFEKFANISSRRGGFLSLFHLHYSMKMNFLGGLSRLLYGKDGNIPNFLPTFLDHNSGGKGVVIKELVNSVLPLFKHSLVALSPIMESSFATIESKGSHNAFIKQIENIVKLDHNDLSSCKLFMEENYICFTKQDNRIYGIPTIEEFGTDKVYLAIRVMELAQTMYFDVGSNSRTKHHSTSTKSHPVEANILFLLQSVYSDAADARDSCLFETMLEGTLNVFLTAFHPFDRAVSSTSTGGVLKCHMIEYINRLFEGSELPHAWHEFTDEYLDVFYEEQLAIIQNAGEATISNWLLYQKYREYRLALRERRLLAFSSLDGLIDVWRQCLNFINTHTPPTTGYNGNAIGGNLSGIERAFVKYLSSNNDYSSHCNYHPELFKRYLYYIVMKYLIPVFSHPLLPVLPATLVKNILDLMNLSIKVAQEIRTWHIKTPSKYYQASSNISSSNNVAEFDRSQHPSSRRGQRSAVGTSFSPNEETIVALIEMGFERSDIVRAITAHRTNNIMQLVPILIENPPPPSPPHSATVSVGSGNSNNTHNPAEGSNSDANIPEVADDNADNPMRALFSSLFRDGTNSSSSLARSGGNNTLNFVLNLPHVPVFTEDELKVEKAFVHKLAAYLQHIAPGIYFSAISHGPSMMADLMDLDLYNQNITITKELFTMQLMTQMLKLFEGYSFTEPMVLSIQTIALYKESLRILSSNFCVVENTPDSNSDKFDQICCSIGGILHALIILLSSKIINLPNSSHPQRGNNTTTSCELAQYLVRQDIRYNSLHLQLLDLLDRAFSCADSASFEGVSHEKISWIAPSILLLDLMHQSLLIDHDALKTSISEMEYRFANGNRSLDYVVSGSNKFRSSSRVFGVCIDDIISPDLRLLLKATENEDGKKRLEKDVQLQSQSESQEFVPINSSEVFQSLPLLSSCLDIQQQIRFAHICSRFLSMISKLGQFKVKDALFQEKVHDIFRASLQTLVHLQNSETMRQTIQSLKSPLNCLQIPCFSILPNAVHSPSTLKVLCKFSGVDFPSESTHPTSLINFDGILVMLLTLIQRQFEDESYLAQSMTVAMKLIFDKLRKEINSHKADSTGENKLKECNVLLKSFMELACPLLYRNQSIFLQVFSLRYQLKQQAGNLFVILKDNNSKATKSVPPVKSKIADNVATSTIPALSGSPTPIKKLKSSSSSSVVTKSEIPDQPSASLSTVSANVKRKISSTEQLLSDTSFQASSQTRTSRNHAAQEIVDEICNQIVRKWVSVSDLFDSIEHMNITEFGFTISDLLYLVADLAAAVPPYSSLVNHFKVQETVLSVSAVKIESGSFISFVLRYLFSMPHYPKQHTFHDDHARGKFTKNEIEALRRMLLGENFLDSCHYFVASMLLRPGENRNLVILELNTLLPAEDLPISSLSSEILHTIMKYCDLVQSLLNPPASWLQRDSFILPVKDISQVIFQTGLPKKIFSFFSKFPMSHPLSTNLLLSVSAPIDSIVRRAQQFSLAVDKDHLVSFSPEKKHEGGLSSSMVVDNDSSVILENTPRHRRETEGSDHSEFLDDGLLLSGGERRLSQAYQDHLVISHEDQIIFGHEADESMSVTADALHNGEDEEGGETSDLEPHPHDDDDDEQEDDDDDEGFLEHLRSDDEDEQEIADHHHSDSTGSEEENDSDESSNNSDSNRSGAHEDQGVEIIDLDQNSEDEDDSSHMDENDNEDEMAVDIEEEINSDQDISNSASGLERRHIHQEAFESDEIIDEVLQSNNIDEMMNGNEEDEEEEEEEEMDDMDEDEVDLNAASPENPYMEDGEDVEQLMSNALGLPSSHLDWTLGIQRRHGTGGNRRNSLRDGLQSGRHRAGVSGGGVPVNLAGQILGEILGDDLLSGNPLISIIDGNEVRLRIDGPARGRISAPGMFAGGPSRRHDNMDPTSLFHQLGFDAGNEDVTSAPIPLSASSARLDPRTGALTLSFDGRIPGRTLTSRPTLSVASIQPPLHPLLTLIDTRRGRFFGNTNANISSIMAGTLGLSSGRNDPYFVVDARSSTNVSSRSTRIIVNPRKSMGPLVSNRRWGADIGEIESPDSRVSTLTNSIGRFYSDNFGPPVDQNISKDQPANIPNDISNSSKLGGMLLENLASGLRSFLSGVHREENSPGLPTFSFRADAGETKEEDDLQESKEGDDIPSLMIESSDSIRSRIELSQPESATNEPPTTTINVGDDNMDVESHNISSAVMSEQISANQVLEAEVAATVSENLPNNASVEVSVENLEFLDSLPPDLRQEVLLAAEEPFLLSLPLEVQHEARLLREQQVIEEQVFSYARQQQTSGPTATTGVSSIPTRNETAADAVASTSSVVVEKPPVVELNVPDEAWYISITGNIENGIKSIAFNAIFIARVFNWLLKCKNEKIPSTLLKLFITLVKHDSCRREVMLCLIELTLGNTTKTKSALYNLESSLGCKTSDHDDLESEISTMVIMKSNSLLNDRSSHYRKFLAVIGFLLKKTEMLVWYEVMVHPSQISSQTWLFGLLLDLLDVIARECPSELDTVLHLLEKVCSPFSKLTSSQVNKLVQFSESPNSDKFNATDSPMEAGAKSAKRLIPFPVLIINNGKILASIVSCSDCSSSARKTLMRVMRYISLYDSNWTLLLNELSVVAMDLVNKAMIEFQNLHNTLLESLQNEENAAKVMCNPKMMNKQIFWEIRLLNTLRLMTVLRSRSGAAAYVEADVVSQFMKQIHGGKLWDILSDCLDIVRELEGIQCSHDVEVGNPLEKKIEKSSLLTMRFVPLVECFLTVCAKTMLVKPSESTSTSALSGSEITRVNSMLPGSRFRQSSNYLQMQLEVQDEISSRQLLRFTEQNAVLLNIILKHNVHLLESSFSPLVTVPKCRSLLHFDIKRSYFKSKLKRLRQSSARSSHGSLRISVRRQRVFEESFQQLRHKSADDMRRRLSVAFHNEEGMDAGGLTREWYSVLAREIFNANYALFCSTGDNVTFQPNPHSYVNPEHLSYFKFVGRIIGKAICDDYLLDAHFTRSFYKHMLGIPVTIQDLEAIEPEYYKSMIQILGTPLDLLGLELSFCAEANEFGQISTIDLIPNGREIIVTDDTKHDYVKLVAHHRMTTAIRKQIDAFLEGFHELVPPELISIFDAQELELLISGLPDIDLDDLRANTEYHGYKSSDPIINHFWNILKSFSAEEKALFLQFVTGTSKVPLDGFKALQGADGIKRFNIHKAFGSTSVLPTAHTCFNQLDLPEYQTEETMREKLSIAIHEGSEGFGFA